ncbi:hypothetical protein DL95DRAFT_395267 [Leptodontidium sp. 2 PMI_412]|nr:hypothetical protein DL95DRAFT_395267 [Leptodontidium sp. 2 PMI_412]
MLWRRLGLGVVVLLRLHGYVYLELSWSAFSLDRSQVHLSSPSPPSPSPSSSHPPHHTNKLAPSSTNQLRTTPPYSTALSSSPRPPHSDQ